MKIIKISGVYIFDNLENKLSGFSLDLPVVGTEKGNMLSIRGWVIGSQFPVIDIECTADGQVLCQLPVDNARPDVAQKYADTPGAQTSGFSGTLEVLSASFEIHLRAILDNRQRVNIALVHGYLLDDEDKDLRNAGIVTINNQIFPSKEKTVVVLGVARSGTSMVAGVLEALGVFMGAKRDPVVFEDVEISEILEQQKDLSKLSKFIDQRNNEFDIWGWKRPGAIRYIDKYDGYLRNPHFVVVFRDIFSIALRNALSMNTQLIHELNSANEEYCFVVDFIKKTKYPCILISYEKAITNKSEFVEKLSKFLNLSPGDKQILMAQEFIERNRSIYLRTARVI